MTLLDSYLPTRKPACVGTCSYLTQPILLIGLSQFDVTLPLLLAGECALPDACAHLEPCAQAGYWVWGRDRGSWNSPLLGSIVVTL